MTIKFADSVISIPNGAVNIQKPNGRVETISPKEEMTIKFADGRVETIVKVIAYPDGNITIKFPDGRVTITRPNNGREITSIP